MLILLVSACGPTNEERAAMKAAGYDELGNSIKGTYPQRFVGDIVYLKPDSTKAVITDIDSDYRQLTVRVSGKFEDYAIAAELVY